MSKAPSRWNGSVLILVAGLLLSACFDRGAGSRPVELESGQRPATTVETEDVTVTGPVRRIIAPQLLEVGEGDRDPVLVLLVSEQGASLAAGDVVEATGPIRPLDLQALEAELRVPLRGRGLEPFEGMRCVVTSSVKRRPGRDTERREGGIEPPGRTNG